MSLQVLVAAMNENPHELAEKMNLQTDAIIVNQCDRFEFEEFHKETFWIKCFSMKERGVGLSRNTALMRACADYVLFSDEDIRLDEDYEKIIIDSFAAHPDADLITFNMEVDPRRKTYENTDFHRIRFYNFGRYPTYAVAARREALVRAGVSFSLLFGGGARYSAGEDSLFLHDCLKAGLHLYADKPYIGQEIYRESTWFKGFNEKFFFDRGVLYPYLYGRFARLWAFRFLFTKRKEVCKDVSFRKAMKWMKAGIKEGRNIRGKGVKN